VRIKKVYRITFKCKYRCKM